MENLDLLIFTSVLVILFILFGIATYRQFTRMEKQEFNSAKEQGGAENFLKFLSKLFDS